jgi:hypothetical protein
MYPEHDGIVYRPGARLTHYPDISNNVGPVKYFLSRLICSLKRVFSSDVTGGFVPAGAGENSLWREAGMPMKKYNPEQIGSYVTPNAAKGLDTISLRELKDREHAPEPAHGGAK